ncbi:interleukin-10 [Esox lucius]|uniref:Interleukin family protein n=1 Tax=Esox lucius TaxID=8010 RepID=A0A3P9A3Q1_ESOLU|nr:interleukin-10 [Esox lucius]XP_019910418.1 interleukin-10 [Esox lucius]XP_034143511.1 interleukin-10 [Esox lucius]XP_034143512.1 interleukin-10 [Esox lucius]XP_034143513.1 interleukin-10 [Esox lucius]XP_034143514.1 interleukin-10 [Esox lucius]XP_034143515.1 interleukin-10 [Esox lucius]XP_034143516.1 interleukin-10 [Esox lucius]XP_034143517.1 interleukin-10 [Esox lucius]XP_034143519.1 interleukin-10 [Esox lucius]XP_034143520.1 interleukin-10 [Esox lucius]XP_034143521.1 interleukin-10 [
MSRLSVLLFLTLVAVLWCEHAQSRAVTCSNRCCSFIEGFPVRLKELRTAYSNIRDYYEANDALETALLDESLLHNFMSPFGCHAIDRILKFYLDTVLPTAVNNNQTHNDLKSPIDSIGNIFHELKKEMIQCRNYFSCKKPFDIQELISSYKKMEANGLYKAMGELDLLFNYIEEYLVSKRRKQ